jgi:SAM-dependent methyltransferase
MHPPVDLNALAEKIKQEAARHSTTVDRVSPRPAPGGRNFSGLVSTIQGPSPDPTPEGAGYNWSDLIRQDDVTFVRTAYIRLLGRQVDNAGLAYFLGQLRTHVLTRLDVLWSLVHSEEGRARGTHVEGLRRVRMFERVGSLRWIGRPLGVFLEVLRLPGHLWRINRRFSEIDSRLDDVVAQTNAGLLGTRRALIGLEEIARAAHSAAERIEDVILSDIQKLEERQAETASQLNEVNVRIESFATYVGEMDGRLNGLVNHVGEMDGRLNGVVNHVGEMDGRLNGLVNHVGEMDGPLNGLVNHVGEMDGRLNGLVNHVGEMDGRLNGLAEHTKDLDERFVGLTHRMAEAALRLDSVRDRVIDLNKRLEEPAWRGLQGLHEKLLDQQRVLVELAAEARTRLPAALDRDQIQALADTADGRLEALYVALEDRFRGDRSIIGARLSRYLPTMQGVPPVQAGGLVLDIGCGRGEWLTLLGQTGIRARGLDLSRAMVALCTDAGLDVVQGDAVGHLRTLPDGSLAAVTAFHVVEHLRFQNLLDLLDEVHRVLAPGGLLVLETPNPENLVVGACMFHLDPTHQAPLPPELLRFLAINRGFARARVVRTEDDLDESRPEQTLAPTEVNDWFRAPPDYALLASKTG